MAGLAIDIGYVFHVCEDPHKPNLAFYADLRLIGVDQLTITQPCDQCIVSFFVCLRCLRLEAICRSNPQMKAE